MAAVMTEVIKADSFKEVRKQMTDLRTMIKACYMQL
jgi:hypothetical protein